jgi:DNA-binding response OmpR family regulator
VPAAAATSNLVAFPRSPELAAPRIRVLVVDDSPTVRQQLSIAFARMNVLCDTVASADEALARLPETHYDLVLVDVVMPGVDGYKLTRQIRRRHRGVPVIILTSRSSPFDLARGALAGCNSYLVKPVPLRQLEAAVVKQLRKSLAIDDLAGLLRLSPEPQALAAARHVHDTVPLEVAAELAENHSALVLPSGMADRAAKLHSLADEQGGLFGFGRCALIGGHWNFLSWGVNLPEKPYR